MDCKGIFIPPHHTSYLGTKKYPTFTNREHVEVLKNRFFREIRNAGAASLCSSHRSKLTVLCFILSCMYHLSMGETLIKFSYLILSYVADIPPPPSGSDLLYKLPKMIKFHEFNRNSFDHVAKVLPVHLLTCSSPLTLDIAYDHIKGTNTVLNKDNHHFYFNKYFTAKWVSLHENNKPILTYLTKYRNRHQTAVTVCRDIHCLGR